ncbi:unnamed protein product [Ilex paraguariensis]|uniref:Uncharacterized protein n=1 Tax=Ilex paraguariensis TaxID=185542 RepID=A0ABC8R0Y8_9AQUA
MSSNQTTITSPKLNVNAQVWTTGTMGELSPLKLKSIGLFILTINSLRAAGQPSPSPFLNALHVVHAQLNHTLGCGCSEEAPVIEIDGRIIGDGRVGPVTQRLQNAYKKMTGESGVSIPTYHKT